MRINKKLFFHKIVVRSGDSNLKNKSYCIFRFAKYIIYRLHLVFVASYYSERFAFTLYVVIIAELAKCVMPSYCIDIDYNLYEHRFWCSDRKRKSTHFIIIVIRVQ